MIPRILEPEVMDTAQEAADYDAMDHGEVNRLFVDDLLMEWHVRRGDVLDVGTGTAQIPIELSRRDVDARMTGIDLAEEMLIVGRRNIDAAGARNIRLERADAKQLPCCDATFDVVMSNSIVHHVPEPTDTFAEMRRVLRPGGLLFVRDLLRPGTAEDVEQLVAAYAGNESPRQQQLFRQSLHAALSIDELLAMLPLAGISTDRLSQTSDRHWTLIWRR